MDYQNSPLQNSETHPDRPSELQPSIHEEGLSGGDTVNPEPEQPPRRRRSRHEDRSSASRARDKGRHSKGRSKLSTIEQGNRIVLWGCFFLGAVAIFAAGLYFGQKFGQHAEIQEKVIQQEAAFPQPEADALLDAGFEAFQKGGYRDAMMDFQKAQDKQPTLFGIDYLIAEASYRAGEKVLAEDAAGHALSKNENVEQARVLLALIDLDKSKSPNAETQLLADPSVTAESAIKQLVASHLANAKGYQLWGDFLRSNGSYRSAADVLHKGVVRADPESSRELLSAKEQLARLQNEPAKAEPSLSELTSMTGEQALVAALAALQMHQGEEAASFLERAKDLYSPQNFRILMKDLAFADYSSDPQVKQFFTAH